MASTSKRSRLDIDENIGISERSDSESDAGGISSSEESEIDWELQDIDEESSDDDSVNIAEIEVLGDESDEKDAGDVGDIEGSKRKEREGSHGRVCSSGRRKGRSANLSTHGINVAPRAKSYGDPDVGNDLPDFSPNRPPGIHFEHALLRNTMTTAVEFFRLFFTTEMINSIVSHTNSYAYIKIAEGTHASYTKADGSWQETTPEEINRLIALLIYFGLVKVGSNLEKYWSVKSLYHGLWARAILPRPRFRALLGFLHVVDPTVEDPGNKLREVGSFINCFKERCKLLYQPQQNMAVDERMVKSRHRSGIRQYIRDKPVKWGIKLWVLADSANGYTVDFDVYIGRSASGNVSENGLGYDVVMKLIQPFLHQGYHLFFDNFYTSFALVNDLFSLGVPSTGTVSAGRKGFPDSLKDVKEWSRKAKRGDMRWVRSSNCLALQWLDNKPVSLITSIDNANDSVEVERKVKSNNVWGEVNVRQPKAISRYNMYMNAVDRSDQILTTNNVSRKCYRWWKTLFFHLIDMAVVNSFLLFREHRAKFPENERLQRPSHYSLVDYRDELVRQICGFPEYDVPPQSGRVKPIVEFETAHMPLVSDERKNCVVCYKEGRGQRRVHTYCSAEQCGRFMHIQGEVNCFQRWHSKEFHKE